MFASDNNAAATQNNNNNGKDFEKAIAFINMYLPTTEGGRVKLDFIALKASSKVHKAVLDHIMAGNTDDERQDLLVQLLSKVQVDFTLAEGKTVNLAL